MSFSTQADVVIRIADGTDFASPRSTFFAVAALDTTDTTQTFEAKLEAATTPGTTVATSIDTVRGFVVKNLDAAVDVTVTWTDADSSDNSQKLAPGATLFIQDAVTTLTLIADSDAAPGPFCDVFVYGTSA